MPKNHNTEDSYSVNILFTSFTTGSQSIQHQPQLNASSPFILTTSPKLPVNFNLPVHFNRRRGVDGEGFVQGTGTSLQGEPSRTGLPASIRFQLV